jgi:hypothetical protein
VFWGKAASMKANGLVTNRIRCKALQIYFTERKSGVNSLSPLGAISHGPECRADAQRVRVYFPVPKVFMIKNQVWSRSSVQARKPQANQHGGTPLAAPIDHSAGTAPSLATGVSQDTWASALGQYEASRIRYGRVTYEQGIKRLQKGEQLPLLCCVLLLSTELPGIHRFIPLEQEIPTASSSFPGPEGRPSKGSSPLPSWRISCLARQSCRPTISSFRLVTTFAISSWVMWIFNTLNRNPRFYSSSPSPAATEGRIVYRAVFLTTEFHWEH